MFAALHIGLKVKGHWSHGDFLKEEEDGSFLWKHLGTAGEQQFQQLEHGGEEQGISGRDKRGREHPRVGKKTFLGIHGRLSSFLQSRKPAVTEPGYKEVLLYGGRQITFRLLH